MEAEICEALDSKQLARRWRQLNQSPKPSMDEHQEFTWRARTSKKLSSIHNVKSIQECVFFIEDSRDADLAFELQASDCKWRWDTYLLGPRTSAKILSKHLIFPLLSVTHLAFSSADPVCELTLEDLQQAVDKVAKTGRRAQDVHVRQTMSRPRVATTLARMTAMFNFVEPIPPIISDVSAEENDDNMDVTGVHLSDEHLHPSMNPSSSSGTQSQDEPRRPIHEHDSSSPSAPIVNPDVVVDPLLSTVPDSASWQKQKQNTGKTEKAMPVLEASSATEPESGDEVPVTSVGTSRHQTLRNNAGESGSGHDKQVGTSSRASSSRPVVQVDSSSDSSQPRRASKKAKLKVVPEDSDISGNEANRGVATRLPSHPASAVRGASVRQPIKRGGRRF